MADCFLRKNSLFEFYSIIFKYVSGLLTQESALYEVNFKLIKAKHFKQGMFAFRRDLQ